MTDNETAQKIADRWFRDFYGPVFNGEALHERIAFALKRVRKEERDRLLQIVRAEKADWRGSVGAIDRIEAAVTDPVAGQMIPVCEDLRCDDGAAP